MSDLPSLPTADLVETLLGIMRGSDPEHAKAQAHAMIAAATGMLRERFGSNAAQAALGATAEVVREHVVEAVEARTSPARSAGSVTALTPSDQAFAALNMLRAMPREEAHERARAVVAGSGAYLHETYGHDQAAVLLDETLQMAADHGRIMRGGRNSGVALH